MWAAGVALVALLAVLVGLNVGGLRDRLLGGVAPGQITSIAVLPLQNLMGDPEQDYFVAGMHEALITELSKIGAFVESWGGVRPEPRKRSERHLSLHECEEISRCVAAGDSLRSIGVRFGRAASTISRELARNGGRSRYRAHRADRTV